MGTTLKHLLNIVKQKTDNLKVFMYIDTRSMGNFRQNSRCINYRKFPRHRRRRCGRDIRAHADEAVCVSATSPIRREELRTSQRRALTRSCGSTATARLPLPEP